MAKPPKQSVVTIQDVARAAGVSVTTASRVLNNKDDVSPETYAKVRRVIEDLNYTASLAARSMRSRASNVLGLVLPEVTEPFEVEVIKGVGEAIKGSGYDLLIYASGSRPLSDRAPWEQEHVSLLSGGLTDGLIVVTPSAPSFPAAAQIVVIDPHGDGTSVPSVIATNHVCAMAAMKYLLELGHRRIGFIQGRPDTRSAARRLEAYCDSLAAAGIAYDPELVQEGDYTHARGLKAARQLLGLADRPTAIFAANDNSAIGVLDAARELGLRVPEDLSVVGFDNIPETEQQNPRLTTVDQSIQEMGRLAVSLLIRMLQGERLEGLVYKVPTHLIVRESCQSLGG